MPLLVLALVSGRATAVGTKRICVAFCSHLWDNRTSAKAKRLKLIKQRMEAQLDTGNVPEIRPRLTSDLACLFNYLVWRISVLKQKISLESKTVPRVFVVLFTSYQLVPYICSLVNRVMCINNHQHTVLKLYPHTRCQTRRRSTSLQQLFHQQIFNNFLVISHSRGGRKNNDRLKTIQIVAFQYLPTIQLPLWG